MTEEMKFFLFLLERYAAHKGLPTGEVLKTWEEAGVTREIFDGYPEYHTECMENAFEDIDSLVASHTHAW